MQLPPHHLQAQRVFEPRLASMPGAAEAAAALPELFPLGQLFKASRRGRKRIGTDNPSDDFHRLLAEGGWPGGGVAVGWGAVGGGRPPAAFLWCATITHCCADIPARPPRPDACLPARVAAHPTCLPAPLAASAGDIDGAREGLADAIPHLVLGSLNDTTFQLVRRCSGSGGTCLCDSSDRQNSITQSAS